MLMEQNQTTTAMGLSRLAGRKLQINVSGNVVKESECERILGILANNKLMWWNKLYGDKSDPTKPIPGLISHLSKCVGLLSRLVDLVPAHRFKVLVDGIFNSKLCYCLELTGFAWGAETMQEGDTRQNAFTKANLLNLQFLQNKVMRMITGSGYNTPVKELLQKTNSFSVNQLIVYKTLTAIFKIKRSGEPRYLANRLGFEKQQNNNGGIIAHRRLYDITNIDFRLARGRESLLYRGCKLWYSLDLTLKVEGSLIIFKQRLRDWILTEIPPLPWL